MKSRDLAQRSFIIESLSGDFTLRSLTERSSVEISYVEISYRHLGQKALHGDLAQQLLLSRGSWARSSAEIFAKGTCRI